MSLDTVWTIEAAARLCDWMERTDTLEALTNAALATAVEDHLWTALPMLTPASDLLSEVIDRLRHSSTPPLAPRTSEEGDNG